MSDDSENDVSEHENAEEDETDKSVQSEELVDDDDDDDDDDKDDDDIDDDQDDDEGKKKKKKKKLHKLSLDEMEDFNAKLRKRGVVYLSRIPPRMGPAKLKQLLGEYGAVTRVYLVEEDKAARKRRLRHNNSRGGKRYVEGWVEFEKKHVAKAVGQQLNGNPITNHKRNVHYGDLWSIKYLRKFQWSHLTEKVAYERRVREQKLRVEMMQAQRENTNYAALVEAGKTMDHIEKRLERKRKTTNNNDQTTGKDQEEISTKKKKRSFKQKKLLDESSDKATKRAVLQSLVI